MIEFVIPDEPPSLFGYGRRGVPGEFSSLVAEAYNAVLEQRGQPPFSGFVVFFGDGVERLCQETLEELTREQQLFIEAKRPAPSRSKVDRPKVSKGILSMTYMLHAYCAQWNRPAPLSLLWLTFAVLGLQEQQPGSDIETRLGLPTSVDDKSAWLEAAALDGEADAKGEGLSAVALAQLVKSSARTVSRWRALKQYQSRRTFCKWLHSSNSKN